MDMQLSRNGSQEKTAIVTPNLCMSEEIWCLTCKWYFSRKEIEDHSPSRMDGINHEEEAKLRKLLCSFLQELGIELKVPQVTIATAIMFCHRFFMRQSLAKNDWQTIATASMFLACKAEETPRWLCVVAVVAYKLMYKWDPSAPQRIGQRDVCEKQKELILTGERLLLYTLAFDLNIEHPYKPLVAALKRLEISEKELAKVAWNFVNDWLQTTLCLEYKPHYIAAGSMFLAAKFQKVKLPTEQGKVWWMQFDVSPKLLEEVIQRMLGLLEKNRKQALSSTCEKLSEPKHALKKVVINNPQSGIINHSNAAQGNGLRDKMDAEAPYKSSISSSPQSCIINSSMHEKVTESKYAVMKAVPNNLQSGIVNCSNVDQGNSQGDNMDAEALNKSCLSNSLRSGIISGSNVRGLVKSVTSDSSQSCVLNGPDCFAAVSKCCENEISNDYHVSVKENLFYQTSDCGSATSAVEDGKLESRAGESDQSPSSKVIHVQMGENKLDVNRIREALKRRRRDRIASKKSMDTVDDEIDSEAWIEKELENGIELESASVYKRKRL